MKTTFLTSCLFALMCGSLSALHPANPAHQPSEKNQAVILVGAKSHPAGVHEYLKSARLIKVLLENSYDIEVDLVENGWPDDVSTLENADLILTISDGQDGPHGSPVPFMTDERMAILEKQMERGCGFMTYHFSTFAPDAYGKQMLTWGGGYFDWQNEAGEREWHSDIQYRNEQVELPSPDHPICRGVEPFTIWEEYYFDLRFMENDKRLNPLVQVPSLASDRKLGNVVAWAVEREDGGRGFGTTMGHFHANWKNDAYRKLILNAIVWAAGGTVPDGGIDSEYLSDREVTQQLYGKAFKALILTGNQHPMHLWQETTPVIKKAIETGNDLHVDVSTNIHDLFQYDLRDYDFLVFNYCNWKNPSPIDERHKKALIDYVDNGGGLMFIHFANGAFHTSLPEAGDSDWAAYRSLCRRVWDHSAGSAHDKYGLFQVQPTGVKHPITQGIQPFSITDELYYNQQGEEEIEVLLEAKSMDTGNVEPLAWVYQIEHYHQRHSRVFQTVLGHDVAALQTPTLQKVLANAAQWLAEGSLYWDRL